MDNGFFAQCTSMCILMFPNTNSLWGDKVSMLIHMYPHNRKEDEDGGMVSKVNPFTIIKFQSSA